MYDNIFLRTCIINLKKRPERLKHVMNEFDGKPEFNVKVVEAVEHEIGAFGLWQTLNKIVREAIEEDEDVLLICEDDHQFTNDYSKEYLFSNIEEAYLQGADILCGGISGGFSQVLPLTQNRFWIDHYWCNQFLIIFRKFFPVILETTFEPGRKVDETLSGLTANKMTLYPFVSEQRFFGYSDVTPYNQENPEWTMNRFKKAGDKLKALQTVYRHYYKK